MSFEAMTWALRQPVGGNEKLVLILIANRIHPDQGFCWPKIDTITEEAGISYSTVQRCIGRLIEGGLITTQRTHNQDGYLGGYRFYMADDRISPQWREFSRTGQNDRSCPSGQNDRSARSKRNLGTGQNDRTKTVSLNSKKDTLTSFVAPAAPLDARTDLFRSGLETIQNLTGKPTNPCRGLLGKWLKACGDDASIVLSIIRDAADLRPAQPVAWIEKAVAQRVGTGFAAIERQIADGFDLDAAFNDYKREAIRDR